MYKEIEKIVERTLDLIDKAKLLPEKLQEKENNLFFLFDGEKKPLEKAVAFKKWKDFILNNIPKQTKN